MIMYAAAMGNSITAVFQCLSAISVNGFLTLSLRCFLPVAFLTREAKRVKSAISYMPIVSCELPYEGAKEMLLVDEVDNKEFLTGLFHAMYDELPTPKPKKKK